MAFHVFITASTEFSCSQEGLVLLQIRPQGLRASAQKTKNTQLLAICEKFGLKDQLCTTQSRSLLNPNSAPVKIQVLSYWGRGCTEKIKAEYTTKDYIIMQKHWAQSFREP